MLGRDSLSCVGMAKEPERQVRIRDPSLCEQDIGSGDKTYVTTLCYVGKNRYSHLSTSGEQGIHTFQAHWPTAVKVWGVDCWPSALRNPQQAP